MSAPIFKMSAFGWELFLAAYFSLLAIREPTNPPQDSQYVKWNWKGDFNVKRWFWREENYSQDQKRFLQYSSPWFSDNPSWRMRLFSRRISNQPSQMRFRGFQWRIRSKWISKFLTRLKNRNRETHFFCIIKFLISYHLVEHLQNSSPLIRFRRLCRDNLGDGTCEMLLHLTIIISSMWFH